RSSPVGAARFRSAVVEKRQPTYHNRRRCGVLAFRDTARCLLPATDMYVWIGTSGYSYQDWVGDFYPNGTRPERMLPYYCRQFPLVELNFTFYKPPTRGMLLRLADKTQAGFQFLVKVPQAIS